MSFELGISQSSTAAENFSTHIDDFCLWNLGEERKKNQYLNN